MSGKIRLYQDKSGYIRFVQVVKLCQVMSGEFMLGQVSSL